MSGSEQPPDAHNTQVSSAVSKTTALVVGVARGQSMALAYEGLANAINLMMLNASHNQSGAQKVEVAMVASTCAAILKSAK